jgi:hypothetical protein
MFGHPSITALSRLMDGMVASPKSRLALASHVSGCGACQVRQQALHRVRAALQSLPGIEESLVMKEPPVPVPVLVGQLVFHRGLAVGLLAGIILLGAIILWVPQPAIKVISSSPNSQFVSSEKGIELQQLQTGSAVRTTMPTGHVDLEIPGQVLLRLKPGTTLTWQQLDRPLFFNKPLIIVNLMRGEMLARTKDSFWGSKLIVRTPTASAFVKGTAFGLRVDPKQDATTLKVIAGSVFFSPYMNNVGVHVKPGQSSRIQEERLPQQPEPITADDWEAMLESYRIGEQANTAAVSLVMGIGPTRVEELLRPTLVYVSSWEQRQIQPYLRKALSEMNGSILRGDPTMQNRNLKVLEEALDDMTDEEIAIPLRLYAGAYAVRMGNPWRAHYHFRKIVEKHPRHPLASLALTALALSAERRGDRATAQENYMATVERYPKSPEASYARVALRDRFGK